MSWTAADIPDLTGKVAVVTGGNGGLGLDTVRELARKGAHVVIGARNLDKANEAQREVLRETPGAKLELHKLDLGSVASIRSFAAAVLEAHPVIDLLFNNAGIMATPERTTAEGFESQFGTNHLGHFELTRLLLPALVRAPAGRIVTTSSTARFAAGRYDLDNPHHRGNYDAWEAYGYSKLANLQFAIELNKRLQAAGSRATSYAADPGLAYTDLQQVTVKENPGGQQAFWAYVTPRFGQSSAAGALDQLRAGTDPAAVPGALYRPRWIVRGAPIVGGVGGWLRKEADLQKLWSLSERDLGVTFDVAAIVNAG